MQSKKIAVTGGIGSGKSTFCRFLSERGYPVYSCDEIYGELIREQEYTALLIERFPDCFPNGVFDKKKLAERVFANRGDKRALESLSHPLIVQRLLKKMEGEEVAFAEVPLLYEGNFEPLFDGVIALIRNREARIASIKERNGFSEEEIAARMLHQIDPETLREKRCIIVENNGTTEELNREVSCVLKQLGIG